MPDNSTRKRRRSSSSGASFGASTSNANANANVNANAPCSIRMKMPLKMPFSMAIVIVAFLALISRGSSFSISTRTTTPTTRSSTTSALAPPASCCSSTSSSTTATTSSAVRSNLYPRLQMSDDSNSNWSDNDGNNENDNDSNRDTNNFWESSPAPNDGKTNVWSTFETLEEEQGGLSGALDDPSDDGSSNGNNVVAEDYSEAWLDTLAAISAEEIEFNQRENERADKARQMQEWGFETETIRNTFGIAVDNALETAGDPKGLEEYRRGSNDYRDCEHEYDDETGALVDSHARVPSDPETGEPIRQQMVYVDEHACIGCTNCATIAESTFFMEPGFGRARVFQQWGDTDDTVATAIETCPVDCIHYVPYNELVALEIDRRNQRINNAARLVNQGESAHMAGTGGNGFTAPQKISGNAGSRCANCPSNGCKNCPMFGVGKNPEYEKKEAERLSRIERRKLEQERAENSKSVDL